MFQVQKQRLKIIALFIVTTLSLSVHASKNMLCDNISPFNIISNDSLGLIIDRLPGRDKVNLRMVNKRFKEQTEKKLLSNENLNLVKRYLNTNATNLAGFKNPIYSKHELIKKDNDSYDIKVFFVQNELSKTVLDIKYIKAKDNFKDDIRYKFKSPVLSSEKVYSLAALSVKASEWENDLKDQQMKTVRRTLYLHRR